MDIVPQLPQTQNNQSQNVYTSIVDDCVTKRTLLVLSKGMRSPQLIAHLIGKLSKEKEHSLTILLNFKKEEIPALNEQIDSLKICRYRIKQITNENTTKRTAIYVTGGIYAVSNVIMVMDLLQRAVSPSIITNLVVNDAEQVDSVLNDEAWITTMIRKENKNLKVLAITDTIDVLAANQGFRKVMHALFLEYCSVWPLSRYEILKDMTEHPDFQTFESHIKLPGPIKKLQKSIMNIIRSCIEEFNRRFKERNKGDDVLNEQDVFNTSMTVVYYKMKAIAGKFNLRGQQLLRDIFEFRMLLLHLIYYDAVEFYLKILTLKNTASFESIWYIGDRKTMEHIEELLKISKQRVFKLKREILVDDKPLQRGFTFDQPARNVFEAEGFERSNTFNGNNGDTVTIASSTLDMNIETIPAEKADETEASGLDVVKNPIKYKGNAYKLDLKININFKYRALVEILKKLTTASSQDAQQQDSSSSSKKKKIIWIWAQEDKKVGKIKDILTSFFAKKDDHKIKLLLKLNVLLKETGDGKTDAKTNIFYDGEDEDYEEIDLPKGQKGKGKGNVKNTDEEAERYIFKRLSIELSHLKKEYDNKCMINLLNSGGAYVAPSQSDTQQSAGQTEETSGNKLVSMLKPKKNFKRKFYDLDDDEENPEEKKEEEKNEQIIDDKKAPPEQKEINLLEQKILQDADRNQGDDEPHIDPVTGIDMDMENYFEDDLQEIANKKVLTNDEERERSSKKQFEYTILNPEKIDLNSFYDYNDDGQVMFDPELLPGYRIIVNHLGSTSERVNFINKVQPDVVLLFEPQLSLIREIMLEKRCSKYGGPKCTISEVHVIMVQNSIESAIYLDNVRRENSSFVTLLNDRSSLPLLDDNPDSRIKKIIYQRNISTRVGRGLGYAASLNNRPMIIVDKREFNSPVPTKLYHDGFWIVPILLEKGDYVLSNSLVVERKCVETGDLLNSMRSGRLENQIRNLCSTYSRPMLLIEFSEGVDFSLESAEINRLQHNINWVNDFGSNKSEINKSNVKFGLALLCMKYPRLTILWSKSPEYTSKLFQKLREENPDPDPRLFAKFQDESEKGNDHDPYARYAHEEEKNLDVKHMI